MERGIMLTFLCSAMLFSQVSGHLFKTLLVEMQDCILDERIPPVANSNENLKILLAAIQDRSSFDKVMTCTARELQKYTNSTDPDKKFLAEKFSLDYGDGSRAETWYKSVPASSWTCLIPAVFDSCLSKAQPEILLKDSRVCSAYRESNGCERYLESIGCHPDAVQTVMMFLDMAFGKCLSESPLNIPTPISVYNTSSERFTTEHETLTSSMVTSDYSQGGSDNIKTDIMPCVQPFLQDYDNARQSINNDPGFFAKAESVCKNTDGILDCEGGKLEYPLKNFDRIIKEIITVNNVRILLSNFCHISPSIAKNRPCLEAELNNSCAFNLSRTWSKTMNNILSTTDFNPKVVGNDLSSKVGEIGKCLTAVVASCDAGLSEKVGVLVKDIALSLSENTYVVLDHPTEPNYQRNSMATLIPTLATLLGSIIITIYI